ncbi:MAG: hypothetical protein ACM3ME_04225 [Chloroflexota bacterium]|nr:hypothetical protein [Lentimicrobium sp.]
MKQTRIIGLLIRDRIKEAGKLQNALSSYSHIIRSRLGFHELNENTCSRTGVIVLTLTGDESAWTEFNKEIESIEGIEIQQMSFTH